MKLIINFEESENLQAVFGQSATNIIHDELISHRFSETRMRQLIDSLGDDINKQFKYKDFDITT